MENKDVKKLLKKLALLLLPFMLWPLIEAIVLPMNFFTFRVWETISVNSLRVMSGPFYPNMHMKMEEEGELAPRTVYAEKKLVEWYTDPYGYRNRDTKAEVLLIGDSNITGAKLSQEETLAEVLERQLGKDVYSFAPATVNRFLGTKRFEENPPEVVVVSSIERRIPELQPVGATGIGSKVRDRTGSVINSSPALTWLAVTADRVSKLALYHRTLANIERKFGQKEYIAFQNEFFIEGEYANRAFSDEEIDYIADVLEGYKHALSERGIAFVFMPIPNKENIYHQLLPSHRKPDFLPRLMAELKKRDVEVVNTQQVFEHLYNEEKKPLYPADDAHWNDIAVEAAASLLAQHLRGEQPENRSNARHLVKQTD
jgi:alginate O-acetyltransferase complex protein AlgJ